MSGERDKILAMLEEGTITAEEADELLQAIDAAEDKPAEPARDFSWPDMPRRGQAWQRPFNFSLLAGVFGGSMLLATRKSSGLIGFVHRFVLWPLTIFSFLAAIVTFFSKDSPWLHVRVQSKDSPTFAVSVPFPTNALHKALQLARDQADDPDVREKIDAAAEILAEMDGDDLKDPLVIDISDEGDSVQVYLN